MRSKLVKWSTVAVLACLPFAAVTAGAAGRPDLRVSGIVEPPSALRPGDEFSTVAVVSNVGGRSAAASHTEFYLSRDDRLEPSAVLVSTRRTHRIRAGGETRVDARIRIPSDFPTNTERFLVACADGRERVRERDERRNCFGSALSVFVIER